MTGNQTSESTGCQLTPPGRRCVSCLLLTIVFASGLLVGAGLTVIFDLDETATEIFGLKRTPPKSRSIAQMCDDITNRYAEELGLSDEQKSKVHEVLTEHFSGALQRRIGVLEKLSVALAPILNDAQRAEWEKLKVDRVKKWSEASPTTRPGG